MNRDGNVTVQAVISELARARMRVESEHATAYESDRGYVSAADAIIVIKSLARQTEQARELATADAPSWADSADRCMADLADEEGEFLGLLSGGQSTETGWFGR